MSVLAAIISVLFLIPFFGWGIYTLRVRFVHNDDLALRTEAITLATVAGFIIVEIFSLRTWFTNEPVLYFFSILGLCVATTALYGPMLVSFASQLFVDVMLPSPEPSRDQPQFGPIEALERVGDYEGAIEECMVVARLFPKDATVALRIAGNLANLDRYEEAAEWFERGRVRVNEADRKFRITTRLAEIYTRRLDRPDEAKRILEEFLEQYPDHDRAETARSRIRRLSNGSTVPASPVPESSSE